MEYHDGSGPRYRDRKDAGIVLASRLIDYLKHDAIVAAIPNGGVPVAIEIAKVLQTRLYLMIVRKLQIPDNPEAGFGAITSDGLLLLNKGLMERLGLDERDAELQKEKALRSIRSRQDFFGPWAEMPAVKDLSVILVDDGLASGFTMEAAVKSFLAQRAKRIIIAVPTSSLSAYRRLDSLVDKIVCPHLSRLRIFAVADAYEKWYDLSERDVLRLLEAFSRE